MNMVYYRVVVWVWEGYYCNVLKKAKGDLYMVPCSGAGFPVCESGG